MKELEGFKLNTILKLDVDYDVFSEMDIKRVFTSKEKDFVSREEHNKKISKNPQPKATTQRGSKMNKRETYKRAIKYWGKELQIGMLMEEVSELMIAINRYRRGRETNKNKIAEEIADVKIMLEQIQVMFNITSVNQWHEQKLLKLKRLMETKGK